MSDSFTVRMMIGAQLDRDDLYEIRLEPSCPHEKPSGARFCPVCAAPVGMTEELVPRADRVELASLSTLPSVGQLGMCVPAGEYEDEPLNPVVGVVVADCSDNRQNPWQVVDPDRLAGWTGQVLALLDRAGITDRVPQLHIMPSW